MITQSQILIRQLKALGDLARLRILSKLPITDDCEEVYNVSELAKELGLPQPTVSHHLNILFNAGLVQKRKMCRDVYYWIDQEAFTSAIQDISEIAKL